MLLIPGIELRNGVCAYPNPVRDDDEPLLYCDPQQIAERFMAAGAQRLHLIDADGAANGEPVNTDVVQTLRKNFPQLQIQVTGGVRKIEHAELWLDVGASFVVVGWKMMRKPETAGELCVEYPGRIMVSMEGHDGLVQSTPDVFLDASELMQRYADDGVSAIFYSELQTPGEHTDPLPVAAGLAKSVDIPVICNGGVHDLDAVTRLRGTHLRKLSGVVVGRCLLNGALDYKTALKTLKK